MTTEELDALADGVIDSLAAHPGDALIVGCGSIDLTVKERNEVAERIRQRWAKLKRVERNLLARKTRR